MPKDLVESKRLSNSGRARPISALRTDSAIIDAGILLLADLGVAGTTPAAVARESNLSITAVRQRYETEEDFLFLVWKTRSIPQVIDPLFNLIDLYLTQSELMENTPPVQLSKLLKQSKVSQATLEILSICSYQKELLKLIQPELKSKLFKAGRNSEVLNTQRTIMFDTLIGLLARGRNTKVKFNDAVQEAHKVLISFTKPTPKLRMPNANASHLDIFTFKTKDPLIKRIYESCCTNVATLGFDRTTTKKIAKDAQASEGLLFSKFKSKLEIFTKSYIEATEVGYVLNLKFVADLIEQFGEAMADAIFLREHCHPDRSLQRGIFLEQLRMSWHIPEVRKASEIATKNVFDLWQADSKQTAIKGSENDPTNHLRIAVTTGAVYSGVLFPESHTLPYICVTTNMPI